MDLSSPSRSLIRLFKHNEVQAMGRKGGKARMAKLTLEQRSATAKKGRSEEETGEASITQSLLSRLG
jgi:hypothetical protein